MIPAQSTMPPMKEAASKPPLPLPPADGDWVGSSTDEDSPVDQQTVTVGGVFFVVVAILL